MSADYKIDTLGKDEIDALWAKIKATFAAKAVEGYFTGGVANNALRLSNTAKIGDTNRPVYFTANGVPAQISYTIGRNVAAGEDVTAYTGGSSIDITNHVVKVAMTAQDSPTTSGTDMSFIDTVSQSANGTITATKKTVRSATTGQSGVVTTDAQSFAGQKTFTDGIVTGSAGTPAALQMFSRVSGGTAQTAMRFASGSDLFIIGEGSRSLGYATDIHGYKINFYYGTNPSSTYGNLGVTLDTNGNFGIGVSAPSTKLHVNGTASVDLLKITNTSASKHIEFSRVGLNYITVPNNGGYLYISMNGAATTTKAYRFGPTDFDPSENAIMSLGTSSLRWNNIYGTVLNISGAATLGSTLAVTGEVSLSSHLTLDNAQTVRFKDTGGTVRNVLQLNANNVLAIGYGTSYNNVGYTNIYGTRVDFTIGQSTLKARIDAQGITSYGGVAAMGIADLSIN